MVEIFLVFIGIIAVCSIGSFLSLIHLLCNVQELAKNVAIIDINTSLIKKSVETKQNKQNGLYNSEIFTLKSSIPTANDKLNKNYSSNHC